MIASAVEHPAIMNYLVHLQSKSMLELVITPVNSECLVDPAHISSMLTPHTALVTVMHSNNEVGSIQPIAQIGKVIEKFNEDSGACVLFHSDAAQSIGKVPVDVREFRAHMVSIVGHKFGAPKGVGALYVQRSVMKCKLLIGGGQENGYRAGLNDADDE